MIDKEVVVGDLSDALKFLSTQYSKNKGWQCPSNPIGIDYEDAEYIVTFESLLCFLLSYNSLSLAAFDGPDLVEPSEIKLSVEKIIERVAKADLLSGHPYTILIDDKDDELGFVDSYCFAISAMIYYAKVFGAPAQKTKQRAFEQAFTKCIDFVSKCAIKSDERGYLGFFGTNRHLPEIPSKYATWMVVETLSDFFSDESYDLFFVNDSTRKQIKFLVNDICAEIGTNYERLYISNDLTPTERERLGARNISVFNDKVLESPDDEAIHNNLWIMLTLIISGYSDEDSILKSLKYMFDSSLKEIEARSFTIEKSCKSKFRSDQLKYREDYANANTLVDRCFLPQFLKLCVLIKEKHGFENRELDFMISESFDWLRNNRTHGYPVWDKFSETEGAPWAVFQTERAVEAYVACWRLAQEGAEANAVDLMRHSSHGGVAISFNGISLDMYIKSEVDRQLAPILSQIEELRKELPKSKLSKRDEKNVQFIKDAADEIVK